MYRHSRVLLVFVCIQFTLTLLTIFWEKSQNFRIKVKKKAVKVKVKIKDIVILIIQSKVSAHKHTGAILIFVSFQSMSTLFTKFKIKIHNGNLKKENLSSSGPNLNFWLLLFYLTRHFCFISVSPSLSVVSMPCWLVDISVLQPIRFPLRPPEGSSTCTATTVPRRAAAASSPTAPWHRPSSASTDTETPSSSSYPCRVTEPPWPGREPNHLEFPNPQIQFFIFFFSPLRRQRPGHPQRQRAGQSVGGPGLHGGAGDWGPERPERSGAEWRRRLHRLPHRWVCPREHGVLLDIGSQKYSLLGNIYCTIRILVQVFNYILKN